MVSDYPVWGIDRPRGILSSADREFLLASEDEREETYTRQGKGKRERAIRERLVNAILDFSLLFYELDDRNCELIFNPHKIDNEVALRHGLRDAIALFYLETYKPKYGETTADVIDHFELLLKSAVWTAEKEWRGVESDGMFDEIVSNISVHFSVTMPDPVNVAQIAEKIYRRSLYELNEDEARFYLHVQWRCGDGIHVGEEAAEDLLDNVDRLTEDGIISVETVGM